MKKRLVRIMPVYSWVMLTILLLANYLAYFASRIYTSGLKHYSVVSALDRKLPFIPFFIFFYLLAYVQWIVGYILIGRGGKETASRILTGELIAKGIVLICFVRFPTTIAELRPNMESLQGGGIWSELTAWLYTIDAVDNGFPSVHCLESWICFRGSVRLKEPPKWYVHVVFVMTMLVFASTVLIKQHALFDILGGVGAAELGLFFSGIRKRSLGKI